MKFLKNIFGKRKNDKGIYFYVRCSNCGENIRVRINPATDINGNLLKKEILGNNCSALIYAKIRFDKGLNIVASDIKGGELISEKEYKQGETK